MLALLAACATTNPIDAQDRDAGGNVLIESDAGPKADGGEIRDAAIDTREANANPRVCSDDGFCHSAVPAGTHFRGLWGDGTGVIWAFTLEQDIVRWDGATWNVHHHSEAPISGIWGSGPTDIWVVTTAGLLHGTGESSAQLSFSPTGYIPGDQTAMIKAVWGTGPLGAWAVGGVEPPSALEEMRGRVLRYVDDPDLGIDWQLDRELSAQKISFHGVWGSPATGVWLHGVARENADIRARLLHRAPGATVWSSIMLPASFREFVGIGATSDASIALIANTTDLVTQIWQGKSDDGGSTFTWTVLEEPSELRPPYAIWGAGQNDLWAVGKSGLLSHWDGSEWKQAAIRVDELVVTRSLWGMWGTSNDDFWVVGDEIALHKSHAGKP